MFGEDGTDRIQPDGEQFDAVGRFEESAESAVGSETDGGSAATDTDTETNEDAGTNDDGETGAAVDVTPSGGDVDPQIKQHFWLLVGVFKLALLGMGIGATLALLSEYQSLGRRLFVAGLIAFAYGVYRYRHARAAVDEIVDDGTDPTNADGTEVGADDV